MTSTKTRHLHAVTDATTPEPAVAVESAQILVRRRARLTEAHDNACLAALDPDVAQQQTAAIGKAMRAAGKDGADLRAILLDLTRAMFVLGHMNGASDQQQAGHLELAADTLAAVVSIDTAQRQEARTAERAMVTPNSKRRDRSAP